MAAFAGSQDIVIDIRNGSVDGAAWRERAAIRTLRMATAALGPVHELGYSYVARFTRRILPSSKNMVLRLNENSQMRMAYCDGYWSTMLLPGYSYEQSVHAMLADSADVDYGFIDCGANHGYWSIMASSKAYGAKKVAAIEAASDTFAILDDNCSLNDRRFQALNNAIGATSGEHVRIYGTKHEARTIVAPSENAEPILDCRTLTIDDVAAMPLFLGIGRFVVKLDVEGVEIPAFTGAKRLLAGDGVFVYEDHGSDQTHETTRHVMDVLGLRVFWLGEGTRREVRHAGELDKIKKSRRFGYDMAATASPFWIERLERLVGRAPEMN